jgi:hypothetical protein
MGPSGAGHSMRETTSESISELVSKFSGNYLERHTRREEGNLSAFGATGRSYEDLRTVAVWN